MSPCSVSGACVALSMVRTALHTLQYDHFNTGMQQQPASTHAHHLLCRMLLPEATRAWRKGVPTVIVMETGYDLKNTSKAFQQHTAEHLEMFADYPDLNDRTFKRGDKR